MPFHGGDERSGKRAEEPEIAEVVMKKKAAVIGTFDTKGGEFLILIEKLRDLGMEAVTIDTGLGRNENIEADYFISDMLAREGHRMEEAQNAAKRSEYLEQIADRAAQVVMDLAERGVVSGAVSMGGGQGSFIAGMIMRALPIGFPKVLLSTIALVESSAKQFKYLNDTLVLNSLVDIAGKNSLLELTISEAAGAMAGMISGVASGSKAGNSGKQKPAVGISAWGVTTPCVSMVRSLLEEEGMEVFVFHANGDGGMVLENLVRQGALSAVADLTLPEISMPLAGAPVSEIPGRLENAGRLGIPLVVAPGGLDMVLSSKEQLEPGARFCGRKVYRHNPEVAFVRSNEKENKLFGKVIAEKLNNASGPVKVLFPLKGLSAIDREDEIFYDPQTDRVLFQTISTGIENPRVEIRELPEHINSKEFAKAVADAVKEIALF